MKFILIVLTLAGQPLYSVGHFDGMTDCTKYVIQEDAKRLCLILTAPGNRK